MDKQSTCAVCGFNTLTPEEIETTGDVCSECAEHEPHLLTDNFLDDPFYEEVFGEYFGGLSDDK